MLSRISLKEYMANFWIDYFYGWKKYEIAWGIIATVAVIIAVIIGWDSSDVGMTILFGVASITNTICVVLVSKQRLSSYFWGVIGVITLGLAYLSIQMPVNAAVNLVYFLPLQFIGFAQWFRKQKSVDIVKVRWGKPKEIIVYLLGTIIITAFIYFYLPEIGGGFAAYLSENKLIQLLDAVGGTGNIIAQLLMNAALIDQWIFWFFVDVTQFFAWLILMINNGGGYFISMFVMYCVWLINAGIGLKSWIQNKK
jgi:nicotinamide mononucleotide transporter